MGYRRNPLPFNLSKSRQESGLHQMFDGPGGLPTSHNSSRAIWHPYLDQVAGPRRTREMLDLRAPLPENAKDYVEERNRNG